MKFIQAMLAMLFLVCLAPNGQPAHAQLTPTSCSVSALQPMSFGSYTPFSPTDTNTATTIQINCSGLLNLVVPYEIQLSSGNSPTVNNRYLINTTGAPSQLNYQAYVDAAHTIVWGDGTSGASISGSFVILLFGSSQTQTAYGRLPGGQSPFAGDYNDDPVMTIIF